MEYSSFFSTWLTGGPASIPAGSSATLTLTDPFADWPLPLLPNQRLRFREGGALVIPSDGSGKLSLTGYSLQLYSYSAGIPIYTPSVVPPMLSALPAVAGSSQQLSFPGNDWFIVGEVFPLGSGGLPDPNLSLYLYVSNSDAVAHSVNVTTWWRRSLVI